MGRAIVQVRRLRDRGAMQEHLSSLGVTLPMADEDAVASTMASPLDVGPWQLTNRFVVLPMEGWDGTTDGRPTDLLRRRWRRFGTSGAALVWGGEAVAVVPEGRANPNQVCIGEHSRSDLSSLREELLAAHREHHEVADPVVGLQLTHS